MITATVLSLVVPSAAGAAFLMLRRGPTRIVADLRGIALQTVIVIVVLLAIAGAVAGVLLTRGGQAVEDLERTDITRDAADYTVKSLCEAAGYTWSNNACT